MSMNADERDKYQSLQWDVERLQTEVKEMEEKMLFHWRYIDELAKHLGLKFVVSHSPQVTLTKREPE